MKLLILGSSGQLGKSLVQLFKYENIICLNKNDLDITNKKNVILKINEICPNIVINAAAYTNVDQAELHSELAFSVNAFGLENLVEACKIKSVPLIHISTDYVFDGLKGSPYFPSDSPNPISIYGKSKLAGEKFIQNYEHGFVIRTSWLFSEFNNNFYKTILNLANHKQEIAIVKDEVGSPTFAGDLADAIQRSIPLIASGELPAEIYHFAGNEPCSWYQFAEVIIAEGYDQKKIKSLPSIIPVKSEEFHKTNLIRPKFSALNSSKLCTELDMNASQWKEAVSMLMRK